MSDFENNSSDSDLADSDVELQEAAGVLKPGLNKVEEKKIFTNDIKGLRQKQKEMKLNLPWIETLDCINKVAPLAPELASKMQEQEDRRENQLKNNKKLPQFTPNEDPVLNDFKRETMFYRLAQATVLEAIPKLKQMNIPTQRPDDYFAEMAKTDAHMQKIREKLMQKQAQQQRSERVKQLRMQRKEGKALQVQAKLDRQKEKREMLDQVKKVKKGLSNDMSFLDGKKKKGLEKRKMRDKKFGFGGKKRGLKTNTKDSAAEITEYKRPGKPKRTSGKGKPVKRLGKNRRMKNKGKGRKK
ncbi:rrna processing protein ebna1-binding protein-related [Holotrichia oblita]|uniref:Rrna processing protein ebna1-binding protein-related n=1 Tax=Holotrichia oblita TaxID=644536 RepID=A0ACB9T200_HOLOL|nr:rrna processing protein ebna1-binding protein-related [Holotrichia oblita]